MNHRQPIRFAPVRGNLRQELTIAHTSRCRQPRRLTYALLNLTGYIHAKFYAPFILRHIEKGFIQRDRFNQVRIVMKDFMQLCRHLFVALEVWLYDNQLRT